MVKMPIRGIKKATAKGRTYYYHRKSGRRIQAEFGTAAFVAEVEALAGYKPPVVLDGTLGGLIHAYSASPEFAQLAARTKSDYQKVFDYAQPMAAVELETITSNWVLRLRDGTFKKRKRRFANSVVQVLSLLFAWGVPRDWLKSNPASRLPKIRRPAGARKVNRPWTDAEVAAVMDAAREGIRIAVALAAHTGIRQGDVLRLQWSARSGGSLSWTQSKTGGDVWVPESAALANELDRVTKRGTNIVIGERGRPYTSAGFQAVFFKLIRRLRGEGVIGEGLTFHGLRHTAATRLADAGCDDRMIMSITGHRTASMVHRYTEKADRKRRATAAIHRIDRNKK